MWHCSSSFPFVNCRSNTWPASKAGFSISLSARRVFLATNTLSVENVCSTLAITISRWSISRRLPRNFLRRRKVKIKQNLNVNLSIAVCQKHTFPSATIQIPDATETFSCSATVPLPRAIGWSRASAGTASVWPCPICRPFSAPCPRWEKSVRSGLASMLCSIIRGNDRMKSERHVLRFATDDLLCRLNEADIDDDVDDDDDEERFRCYSIQYWQKHRHSVE